MKSVLLVFLVLLGLNLISIQVNADIDVYEFSSENNRQRYLDLTRELRCPKCQNQDIADSNAPIAQDMRREVHRMIEEGKGHDDVIDFMVERFGDFVSYKPKVVPSTYVLWYAPAAFVVFGLFIVWLMASRKRNQKSTNVHLDAAQKQKVEQLLSRYDDKEDKSND